MTRIKVCGITCGEDAMQAVDLGVNALGFIFAESPRKVSPIVVREITESVPAFVCKVGVFVDEELRVVEELSSYCGLDMVQLHGSESPEYLDALSIPAVKVFRVRDHGVLQQIPAYNTTCFLLDAWDEEKMGGTGKRFDWAVAREACRLGKVILSGGLDHSNVGQALDAVKPYAVDVCTGVEGSPGKKDARKLMEFIEEVRNWDSRAN